MNVNDFDKNISPYIDGDLNSFDSNQFEKLLVEDPECKKKFDDYKKMLNELSNIEFLKGSNNFMDDLNKIFYEKNDICSTLKEMIISFDRNYKDILQSNNYGNQICL